MSKIIINQQQHNEIPYNEYYEEGLSHKGLVFVQHGFDSNKNRGADYLAIDLARLGFYVVAIDAYKHGLRMEEPFISEPSHEKFKAAFTVITNTADDILALYSDLYQKEFATFDLVGISMGGMIAYNCALKTDKINKLIPVISTPYLYSFSEWLIEKENNDSYTKIFNSIKGDIKDIDPVNKIEQLNYKKLHIINTTNDDDVPCIFSEQFFIENHKPGISLKLYNDTHTVNRDMKQDILSYIAEEKVVL